MSAIGLSAMISGVPAPAPSAPSLNAIGKTWKTSSSSFFCSLLSLSKRNVHDPRALAAILEKAEEELARKSHPDPYIRCVFHRVTMPSPSHHLFQQPPHSPVARNGSSVFFPLTRFVFSADLFYSFCGNTQGTQSTRMY
jgi:hypothetical protein